MEGWPPSLEAEADPKKLLTKDSEINGFSIDLI